MRVFSYWRGPVTWMERLSIASAKTTGHEVTVFSHDPDALSREDLGCQVADAGDVLSDPSLEHLRRLQPPHYSDHFRIVGLQQGLGVWIDLDLIFVKALPNDPYLMGWETPVSVCNALLRLPTTSAILTEYIAICQKRPLKLNFPWYPLGKRVKRQIKRVTHALQGKMLAPLLGPVTLTHLVHKYGLEEKVKPASAFYPVHHGRKSLQRIAEPGYLERCVGPDTITLHLWRSKYRKIYGNEVAGDWLRAQMAAVL